MKRMLLCVAVLLCAFVAPVAAQEEYAYTEGAVVEVTAVKIHDGQFDNYMKYLQGQYKRVMEAQKKAGIVLDYGIYATYARNPDEPDLYLTVVYPNMAALDGLRARSDAVAREITGQDTMQANVAYADRGAMRKILGSELIRKLELK